VILIDASVWINHLRAADERLTALLAEDQVLGHPFILGELALGYLRQRDLILRSLQRLPQAAVASDREVLRLIENERLYGRGIGYIDAHLLAAVRLTPEARLWTRDGPLQRAAAQLSLAAMLPH
jgi:predicted nucleic acid-binding protein